MKIESFLFFDEGGVLDSGVFVVLVDKKYKFWVFFKMLKEEGGGVLDMGNSNSIGGSKKRKLKESYGFFRVYCEKENYEWKKVWVFKEGKELSFFYGSGKLEKKNKSYLRREYGYVVVIFSFFYKFRNSFYEVKFLFVESVSFLFMRKKKVEFYDIDFLVVSSMRRFLDGEGDGGSDRS